jgi:hypothetical protein
VINRDAEVVGLIFDGNLQSLGGDFGFDPEQNRAVAVAGRRATRGTGEDLSRRPHRRRIDEVKWTRTDGTKTVTAIGSRGSTV